MINSSSLDQHQIYTLLVDHEDKIQGLCEKLWTHRIGALHRAVSVYLTSSEDNTVLLQRRSLLKYHSPGLWSNAACTHPLHGETAEEAARRALLVELGIVLTSLEYKGHFIYKTHVGEDLIEHELDHVFVGKISKAQHIPFSSEEVDSVQWKSVEGLQRELSEAPQNFTHWLPFLISYLSDPRPGIDYR